MARLFRILTFTTLAAASALMLTTTASAATSGNYRGYPVDTNGLATLTVAPGGNRLSAVFMSAVGDAKSCRLSGFQFGWKAEKKDASDGLKIAADGSFGEHVSYHFKYHGAKWAVKGRYFGSFASTTDVDGTPMYTVSRKMRFRKNGGSWCTPDVWSRTINFLVAAR